MVQSGELCYCWWWVWLAQSSGLYILYYKSAAWLTVQRRTMSGNVIFVHKMMSHFFFPRESELQYLCKYRSFFGWKWPKVHHTVWTVNAQTYLQLPLWQWGTGNVYLLVLSSWKVNIAENPIAVMGLLMYVGRWGIVLLASIIPGNFYGSWKIVLLG